MENTAIAWEVLGDSTALKPLGILTIKTLRRSLQPCRMLRKTVVHVCFKACKERSPLYRHSRGHNQAGSFASPSKKAAEFLFPTHKTGAGKARDFSATSPPAGSTQITLSDLIYYLHSPPFSENAFSNILSTELVGLCKSRAHEDPATSFPPA